MYRLAAIGFILLLILSACGKFSRGNKFRADFSGDTLLYVVTAKGSGHKISRIVSKMKFEHESRGNSCVIKYLTDSASLNDKKGLLLFNSTLPNIKDDFLSKGFFGQFSSKQIVSYLLVSYEDVDKYFERIE